MLQPAVLRNRYLTAWALGGREPTARVTYHLEQQAIITNTRKHGASLTTTDVEAGIPGRAVLFGARLQFTTSGVVFGPDSQIVLVLGPAGPSTNTRARVQALVLTPF